MLKVSTELIGSLEGAQKAANAGIRLPRSPSLPASLYESTRLYAEAGKMHETRYSALQWTPLEGTAKVDALLGAVRCLVADGRYQPCVEHCTVALREEREHFTKDQRHQLAVIGSHCSLLMGEWKLLEECQGSLALTDDREGIHYHFFTAISCLHKGELERAKAAVADCWKIIRDDAKLMTGSYSSSFSHIVEWQHFVELEEAILYQEDPSKQAMLQALWKRRTRTYTSCFDWHKSIAITSIVLPFSQCEEDWMKISTLAVRQGKLDLAKDVFEYVLRNANLIPYSGVEALADFPPLIDPNVFHCAIANTPNKKKAFQALSKYLSALATTSQSNLPHHRQFVTGMAKCYSDLAKLEVHLLGDQARQLGANRVAISSHLYSAVSWMYMRGEPSAKMLRRWAVHNYEVVSDMDSVTVKGAGVGFAHCALSGFFRVIMCHHDHLAGGAVPDIHMANVVQEAVSIFGILHRLGDEPTIHNIIMKEIRKVPPKVWIPVIPQCIAWLSAPAGVSRIVSYILEKVSESHAHRTMFPLLSVSGSSDRARSKAAQGLLAQLGSTDPEKKRLVEDYMGFAQSLTDVSLLLAERWAFGIEEALSMWYKKRDVPLVVGQLEELHSLSVNNHSEHDVSFDQKYSGHILAAKRTLEKFIKFNRRSQFDSMLSDHAVLQTKLRTELKSLHTFDVRRVHPTLGEMTCAMTKKICIPTTDFEVDDVSRPVISVVDPMFMVLPTQQRPKRFTVKASDGKEHSFLLKGREDLRLDERVMQLFTFVNSLMRRRLPHVSIREYAVVPLSTTAGLVGWVEQADTIGNMVREYRRAHDVPLSVERALIDSITLDYDRMTPIQKLDVFEAVVESTDPSDLARMMQLQSPSIEAWINGRRVFVDTLAAMSMVGYTIGLGDRHPSNIMISQSKNVVHIDFGDCFEIAQLRPRLAEKVPFRATRMLLRALDVSGVFGAFRETCNQVMELLRGNRGGVMSLLSVFVHDPLVHWKLVDIVQKLKQPAPERQEWEFADEVTGTPTGNLEKILTSKTASLAASTTDNSLAKGQAEAVLKRVESKLQGIVGSGSGSAWAMLCQYESVLAKSKMQTPMNANDTVGTRVEKRVSRLFRSRAIKAARDIQRWYRARLAAAKKKASLSSSPPNTSANSSIDVIASAEELIKSLTLIKESEEDALSREPSPGGKDSDSDSPMKRVQYSVVTRYHGVTQKCVISTSQNSLVDAAPSRALCTTEQVEKLISEAISSENICQCYSGWVPFW